MPNTAIALDIDRCIAGGDCGGDNKFNPTAVKYHDALLSVVAENQRTTRSAVTLFSQYQLAQMSMTTGDLNVPLRIFIRQELERRKIPVEQSVFAGSPYFDGAEFGGHAKSIYETEQDYLARRALDENESAFERSASGESSAFLSVEGAAERQSADIIDLQNAFFERVSVELDDIFKEGKGDMLLYYLYQQFRQGKEIVCIFDDKLQVMQMAERIIASDIFHGMQIVATQVDPQFLTDNSTQTADFYRQRLKVQQSSVWYTQLGEVPAHERTAEAIEADCLSPSDDSILQAKLIPRRTWLPEYGQGYGNDTRYAKHEGHVSRFFRQCMSWIPTMQRQQAREQFMQSERGQGFEALLGLERLFKGKLPIDTRNLLVLLKMKGLPIHFLKLVQHMQPISQALFDAMVAFKEEAEFAINLLISFEVEVGDPCLEDFIAIAHGIDGGLARMLKNLFEADLFLKKNLKVIKELKDKQVDFDCLDAVFKSLEGGLFMLTQRHLDVVFKAVLENPKTTQAPLIALINQVDIIAHDEVDRSAPFLETVILIDGDGCTSNTKFARIDAEYSYRDDLNPPNYNYPLIDAAAEFCETQSAELIPFSSIRMTQMSPISGKEMRYNVPQRLWNKIIFEKAGVRVRYSVFADSPSVDCGEFGAFANNILYPAERDYLALRRQEVRRFHDASGEASLRKIRFSNNYNQKFDNEGLDRMLGADFPVKLARVSGRPLPRDQQVYSQGKGDMLIYTLLQLRERGVKRVHLYDDKLEVMQMAETIISSGIFSDIEIIAIQVDPNFSSRSGSSQTKAFYQDALQRIGSSVRYLTGEFRDQANIKATRAPFGFTLEENQVPPLEEWCTRLRYQYAGVKGEQPRAASAAMPVRRRPDDRVSRAAAAGAGSFSPERRRHLPDASHLLGNSGPPRFEH